MIPESVWYAANTLKRRAADKIDGPSRAIGIERDTALCAFLVSDWILQQDQPPGIQDNATDEGADEMTRGIAPVDESAIRNQAQGL